MVSHPTERYPIPFPPYPEIHTQVERVIDSSSTLGVLQKNRWKWYGWFQKIVGFPPKSSIFNRVLHCFHHPFWGEYPLFLETPIMEMIHIPLDLHGTGIFAYMKTHQKSTVHVGKYIRPMDTLGHFSKV